MRLMIEDLTGNPMMTFYILLLNAPHQHSQNMATCIGTSVTAGKCAYTKLIHSRPRNFVSKAKFKILCWKKGILLSHKTCEHGPEEFVPKEIKCQDMEFLFSVHKFKIQDC